MSRTRTSIFALAICQVSLWLPVTGHAARIDGDWPATVEVGLEKILSGNPLAKGDSVFTGRGSYRFFSGQFGLETAVSYADPNSELARSFGRDADLKLVDFSLIWYANHGKQSDYWKRGWRVKPELILFTGPGWALLEVDDAIPEHPLFDASKDFFTWNAGIGAKFYLYRKTATVMRGGEEVDCNRCTSHWFVRPELQARWFAGDGGDVDVGFQVSVGYGFGKRSSRRALQLEAEVLCTANVPADEAQQIREIIAELSTRQELQRYIDGCTADADAS